MAVYSYLFKKVNKGLIGLGVYSIMLALLELLVSKNCWDKNGFIFQLVVNIFNIFLAGYILNIFLTPTNCIKLDKHCIYDADKSFVFRYWIVLPVGKYLYNSKLYIRFTSDVKRKDGTNAQDAYWTAAPIEYSRIRGERYLVLDTDSSGKLKQAIIDVLNGQSKEAKKIKKIIKGKEDKKTYSEEEKNTSYIELMITGTTSDGQSMSSCYRYYLFNAKEDTTHSKHRAGVLTSYSYAPNDELSSYSYEKYQTYIEQIEKTDKIENIKKMIINKTLHFFEAANFGRYFTVPTMSIDNLIKADSENEVFYTTINVNKPEDKSIVNYEQVVLGKNKIFNWFSKILVKITLHDRRVTMKELKTSYKEIKNGASGEKTMRKRIKNIVTRIFDGIGVWALIVMLIIWLAISGFVAISPLDLKKKIVVITILVAMYILILVVGLIRIEFFKKCSIGSYYVLGVLLGIPVGTIVYGIRSQFLTKAVAFDEMLGFIEATVFVASLLWILFQGKIDEKKNCVIDAVLTINIAIITILGYILLADIEKKHLLWAMISYLALQGYTKVKYVYDSNHPSSKLKKQVIIAIRILEVLISVAIYALLIIFIVHENMSTTM